MARATRVDFPGGWYHVLNRGTERRAIFRSTRCCEKFIELLSSLPERFGVRLHGYALMGNHYHLQLESREANLSKAAPAHPKRIVANQALDRFFHEDFCELAALGLAHAEAVALPLGRILVVGFEETVTRTRGEISNELVQHCIHQGRRDHRNDRSTLTPRGRQREHREDCDRRYQLQGRIVR